MAGEAKEIADAVLIREARSGDARAFGRLWDRHHGAALRYATRLVGRSDAEDLVSESFTSIYQAIRNGAGPDELFRPYLYTSLKNLSIRWSIRDAAFSVEDVDFDAFTDSTTAEDASLAALERSYEALAFRSLPQRWQEVLWYGEVEGLKPRDIAPILGMSANAVAALGYRARDGFRKAWLELRAHDGVTVERPREQVLVGRLRAVLVPLLVGIPLGEFLRESVAPSASTAATLPAASLHAASSMSLPTVSSLIAGAALVGAASVLVASTTVWTPDDGPGVAGTTSMTATAPQPGYGEPAGATADVASTAPTHEPRSEEAPLPAAPPASPSAPPAALILPPAAAPVIYSPALGQLVPGGEMLVSGSGTAGHDVVVLIDGVPVGSGLVGPDGLWEHMLAVPLDDGAHELQVTQQSASTSPSAAVAVPFVLDSIAPDAPALTTTISRYAQSAPALSGSAEAGASIVISDGASELATAVVTDDGTWSTAPLKGVLASTRSLHVYQIDRAGNISDELVVPLAFAPRFVVPTTTFSQGAYWSLPARGWPGAQVRTYIDGQPVWVGGTLVSAVPASGNFTAYWGGPYVSLGTHALTLAYVDPVTLKPISVEVITITVTP